MESFLKSRQPLGNHSFALITPGFLFWHTKRFWMLALQLEMFVGIHDALNVSPADGVIKQHSVTGTKSDYIHPLPSLGTPCRLSATKKQK